MKRTFERENVDHQENITIYYTTEVKSEERVEECHGYHYFNDETIIDVRIDKVIITISEYEIDITDRLTMKEKKNIADFYYE